MTDPVTGIRWWLWCSTCGQTSIDEDVCCAMCGRTATILRAWARPHRWRRQL